MRCTRLRSIRQRGKSVRVYGTEGAPHGSFVVICLNINFSVVVMSSALRGGHL